MAVSFDKLAVGSEYERPYLAQLWGYKGFQAISRGVITPAGSNLIVLFVTRDKQDSLTQYDDYLDGNELHWEGEKRHASDLRVVNAQRAGDEIHLFYRERHHSPFVYHGQIRLDQHNLLTRGPSQFIFKLSSHLRVQEPTAEYATDLLPGFEGLGETEQKALKTSRIGQGVFRDGLLRLWGGCAVTGYRRPAMLLASHIKPWRLSTNTERLDPYNGLLLQPTIDRLFDTGLVSFDRVGKLIRSRSITVDELVLLGVNPKAELRRVPDGTENYLRYHRDNELGKTDA